MAPPALSAEARALAATDPVMAALIERIGPRSAQERRRGREPFEELARIIVGQQVSTAAAQTIWGRVLDAFEGVAPTPEAVLGSADELRACGLSGRKVSYVVGLAESIVAGEFEPDALSEASDEEVIAAVTAVRGLGRWSAEMFLMFHLCRPDVFSGGDLGLRHGIRIALELDEPPAPEEAERIAERWRPHRTLASIYLWAATSTPPPDA